VRVGILLPCGTHFPDRIILLRGRGVVVSIIKIKKDTMQSEQFQNPIEKWYKDAKSIPLTHKYMPA
jgi:hypothetical protein